MPRIRKIICLFLYYGIAYNLPNNSFPLGSYFNLIRVYLLRKLIPIGKDTSIMRHVYLGDGNNVSIGAGCKINEGVRLDNVSIGDKVLIARESIILGKMHEFADRELPVSDQGERPVGKTVIEDNVWLGLRVMVMPGLTLGSGSIIGAGAVVTKDTERNGIYGGVPAKLIRRRED
jgi:maltose O-acetyltransferase